MNKLKQLQLAIDYYQDQFDYCATCGTYEKLVEINSKLTTARLALYDYRYKSVLATGEYV